MNKHKPSDLILWCDTEGDGLHHDEQYPYRPRTNHLLEFAAILTDRRLNEISTFGEVVIGWDPDHMRWMRDESNEFVRKAHDESGLWDACAASETSVTQFAGDFTDWLHEHGVMAPVQDRRQRTVLAGNSVHYDMAMIQRWVPGVFGHLHYRLLDVSANGIALDLAVPGLADQVRAETGVIKHRAMDDIRMSIDMLHRQLRLAGLAIPDTMGA